MVEISHWRAKTGLFNKQIKLFAWKIVGKVSLGTWWKSSYPDSILSKIVIMLLCHPITSAVTERNWSLRSRIHTPVRNRFKFSTNCFYYSTQNNLMLSVDRASKLTFIKHSLLIIDKDRFFASDKNSTFEQPGKLFIR